MKPTGHFAATTVGQRTKNTLEAALHGYTILFSTGFSFSTGFAFVEIPTMCRTGSFIETDEAHAYLADNLAVVHANCTLKDPSASAAP